MSILYDPLLAVTFYGSLAGLACWATWRDFDLRWIGMWLVAGFVISNALFFLAPLSWRPPVYSVVEFMVLLSASIALAEGKRPKLALVLLGGVTVVSIASNVAFAFENGYTLRQINRWEVTTNLCFAAECLLATWAGIADGYRTGRFARLPRPWRRGVAPDAARETEQ